eukprot:495961-Hanusia_phi.AAC.2
MVRKCALLAGYAHTSGERPEQLKPSSMVQLDEQPSPSTLFPSSHSSRRCHLRSFPCMIAAASHSFVPPYAADQQLVCLVCLSPSPQNATGEGVSCTAMLVGAGVVATWVVSMTAARVVVVIALVVGAAVVGAAVVATWTVFCRHWTGLNPSKRRVGQGWQQATPEQEAPAPS